MNKIAFKCDAFETFQLIPRQINTEIMHNLEVFAVKVCNKKYLKVAILQNYFGTYTSKI